MTLRITRKRIVALVALACFVFVAAAMAGKPDWYSNDEKVTNQIATKAQSTDPYPINKIDHFLERQNLIKRLLAFNNSKKIGYVYILSYGKMIGYYSIQGKISSTQSQLTVMDQTWDSGSGADTVASGSSMGDDGSYGSEEGGPAGVFFFTTNGTLVETDTDFLYSDKPLSIDVPNLTKTKTG